MNTQEQPAGHCPVDRPVVALACPFCGSKRVGAHLVRRRRASGYQCLCLQCGVAQTRSLYDSPQAATSAWNVRHNAQAERPAQETQE